ncbi:MAG: acyl-CoA dehydrogenase family protein [Myxococcota bacterium]
MEPIDEGRLLEQSARRFAERAVAPAVDALGHYPDQPLPATLLEGLRELGFLELALPAAAGGDDVDDALLATVVGALGETAAAPAQIVLAQALAQRLVGACGNEAAIGRVRPDSEGAVPVLAVPLYAEPGETEAVPRYAVEDDGLRLWGTCEFVVNAPIADRLLIPAVADGDDRIALVLVDAGADGVRIEAPLLTLGMRGGPVADASFDDVRLPLARRLAEDARGLVERAHRRLRGPVAALCAAVVTSSAEAAVAYARERYQGGRFIVEHAEVRRMISELWADRDLCEDAARRLAGGEVDEPRATHLFLRAKEAAARATCDGVQLLGGYGYMEDYGQERRMRDAKQAQCLLGRCEPERQRAMDAALGEVAS